nr:hypothetical protein [Kibdelosporangium sp. MJ126-NF4]CEL16139.1 hypothetical protein [Kibdelosporangium sp. MJ126-NF4]CTQ94065.1 hypothetical protein [Kibdelosporangium sp. MJ126-NF4]
MDLEDELHRLFKDDRLNMKVAPEAETNVVDGARRVRRRRMMAMSAAGVLSAVVLTGGALILAQPTPQSSPIATRPSDLPIISASPDTLEPSVQTTTTQPETSVTTSNTAKPGVEGPVAPPSSEKTVTLGPTGVGKINLGASTEELKRSGQLQSPPVTQPTSPGRTPQTPKSPTNGCTPYEAGNGMIWIGKSGTVAAFVYRSGVTTPEGITIGAPQDTVKTTYRDFTGSTVRVPGNANAKFKFTFAAGKVIEISLLANQQDCVG